MSHYLITAIALIAFAANSLLCRLALAQGAIDAGSFTAIRLISGALTLLVIHLLLQRKERVSLTDNKSLLFLGGVALFIYAITFSFAYLELATGTGALLLFGSVQLTMISVHLLRGNRLNKFEWLGLITAMVGFILLMLPSATAPDLWSAVLMVVSGIAWAAFSMLGQRASSPRIGTTQGFISAAVIILLCSPWLIELDSITAAGALWATVSGVVASAMGYVVWYSAIKSLSLLQASVAQLCVPVIALFAGVALLGEQLNTVLLVSSALILGGIALLFIRKNG
ncbi:EamA family transporter [Vibrio sp. SCSIO 43135]|uniref:DMT family transporter n=1 Tax=Vibrio sp. SCSIO 43135 TaxID=2819096 RepID=UPI0020758AE7|nr:DMT family transporter [Vibrio sp. SCSIO 43135]USD43536.1 EamA family transporter [Vibrio sp. SCSIO 43135]